MALTNEERQIAEFGMKQGKSSFEVMDAVSRYRSSQIEQQPSKLQDFGEDLVTGAKRVGETFTQATGDIQAGLEDVQTTARQEGFGAGAKKLFDLPLLASGNLLGTAGQAVFEPVLTGAKAFTTQETEEKIAGGLQTAVEATGLPQAMEGLSERGQRNARATLGLTEAAGFGLAGKAGQLAKRAIAKPFKSVDEAVDTISKRTSRLIEDPSITPRQQEEIARAGLTFKEKSINLEPDQKLRIQKMGEEKIGEYLDAVHLRNIDDTNASPMEVGADNARLAVEGLEEMLSETGGDIGAVRSRLGTVQANIQQIQSIENSFLGELEKLNLRVQNGEIVQIPGTISKVGSTNDIGIISELYNELRTAKQSPTLTNLIDLRSVFDAKINFSKRAQQTSNDIDPLSRTVRKSIAEETAKMVGKEGAEDVAKYSDFMDAYSDLRSFTDRKAGGEYLLRLVLSGRGGDARKLVETVKTHTGIDLMDDATAMRIATDMFGNERTKTLFAQEVQNAGYDAAKLLRGDPTGLLGRLIEGVKSAVIDEEKVIRRTAKGVPK